MIQIPEELLKMSDKELHSLLDNKNIFTSKYHVVNDGSNDLKIFKVLGKQNQFIIYKNQARRNNSSSLLNEYQITYDPEPLTVDGLLEYKKLNLSQILSNCNNETFARYLKSVAVDIYGEKFTDVTIDSDNDVVDLVIYFPEITITNSVELSHTMYDIYIRFVFYGNGGNRRLNAIYMARTTATDKELNASYLFSHLNNSTLGVYSGNLCFGETDLSSTINGKLKRGHLLGYIPTVIMAMKEYLSWESIEGIPYNFIQRINERTDRYRQISTGYRDRGYYKDVLSNIQNFTYTYDLNDGKYKIKLDQDIVDQIDKYLTEKYPNECYYLINGESCYDAQTRLTDFSSTNGQDSRVAFRGETIKLKVINTAQDDIVEPEKRINRWILRDVVSKLENNFLEYLINKKLETNV